MLTWSIIVIVIVIVIIVMNIPSAIRISNKGWLQWNYANFQSLARHWSRKFQLEHMTMDVGPYHKSETKFCMESSQNDKCFCICYTYAAHMSIHLNVTSSSSSSSCFHENFNSIRTHPYESGWRAASLMTRWVGNNGRFQTFSNYLWYRARGLCKCSWPYHKSEAKFCMESGQNDKCFCNCYTYAAHMSIHLNVPSSSSSSYCFHENFNSIRTHQYESGWCGASLMTR